MTHIRAVGRTALMFEKGSFLRSVVEAVRERPSTLHCEVAADLRDCRHLGVSDRASHPNADGSAVREGRRQLIGGSPRDSKLGRSALANARSIWFVSMPTATIRRRTRARAASNACCVSGAAGTESST